MTGLRVLAWTDRLFSTPVSLLVSPQATNRNAVWALAPETPMKKHTAATNSKIPFLTLFLLSLFACLHLLLCHPFHGDFGSFFFSRGRYPHKFLIVVPFQVQKLDLRVAAVGGRNVYIPAGCRCGIHIVSDHFRHSVPGGQHQFGGPGIFLLRQSFCLCASRICRQAVKVFDDRKSVG